MLRFSPAMFSVTFVRHGETSYNRQQRIQGCIDIPLNDKGECQAKEAGKVLANRQFNRVYASDLGRARKTCELILSQNIKTDATIITDERLRERNFGSVERLQLEEVKVLAAEAGKKWGEWDPPGAETPAQVQERIVAFFKELCQSVFDKMKSHSLNNSSEPSHNGNADQDQASHNILIVSHGFTLKQLYLHLHKNLKAEGPPEDLGKLNAISPNTGITSYSVQKAAKSYEIACTEFHFADHLQNVPQDL